MTVQATPRIAGPFVGNDVSTVFSFSFKTLSEDHIKVVQADLDDIETTLLLNSQYTVTLNGNQDTSPGGSITLTAPLALNYKLAILSIVPYAQTTDIPSSGVIPPEVLENTLDLLVMQTQQLAEWSTRTVTTPASSGQTADELLNSVYSAASQAGASATASAASADASATSAANSATSADASANSAAEALAAAASFNVTSLATLKNLAAGSVDAIYLAGRTATGDGGQGVFQWFAGDQSANVTSDPAEGVWVAPNSDPTGASGAWKRQHSGTINVKWFGAALDGSDDTQAIRAAIDSLSDGDTLDLLGGVIGISDDGGGDSEALFVLKTHGNRILMGGTGKSQNGVGGYFKLLGNISKHIFKIDTGVAVRASGHIFDGLSFSGYVDGTTRRSVAGACIYHKDGDIITYRSLKFAHIAGTALKIVRAVKCQFDDINVQTCGATGYPAVETAGSSDQEATQGSTWTGLRVENTVGAVGLKIGAWDRTNKFLGGTFESSGSAASAADAPFVDVAGYANEFIGFTFGSNLALTAGSYKLRDTGDYNRWIGGHCIPANRASGTEVYLNGTRTLFTGMRFFANIESINQVAIETGPDSEGLTISDISTFQCCPLALNGVYHEVDRVHARSGTGTVTLAAGYSRVAGLVLVGHNSGGLPIIEISGAETAAEGHIRFPSTASSAAAGVKVSGLLASADFNIDGGCNAVGTDYVQHGFLVTANDTTIRGRVRRIGRDAVYYDNCRPSVCDVAHVESYGMQAANTYTAVRKTGTTTFTTGCSIRLGLVWARSVSQNTWLVVSDASGGSAPSLQSLYAFADAAKGLTASITAHASNNVSQGVS